MSLFKPFKNIVRGFTDTIGLTDYEGQEDAERAAAKSFDNSQEVLEEALDGIREDQAEWDNIFGSALDNASDYYNNLDPDLLANTHVAQQQRNYQASVKRTEQLLAKRGLTDSRYADYILSRADYDNERYKGILRASAPELVAKQQAGFAQLGFQRQSQLTSNEQNLQLAKAGGHSNQSAYHHQTAANIQKQNAAGSAFLGETILGGISGVLGFKSGKKALEGSEEQAPQTLSSAEHLYKRNERI